MHHEYVSLEQSTCFIKRDLGTCFNTLMVNLDKHKAQPLRHIDKQHFFASISRPFFFRTTQSEHKNSATQKASFFTSESRCLIPVFVSRRAKKKSPSGLKTAFRPVFTSDFCALRFLVRFSLQRHSLLANLLF